MMADRETKHNIAVPATYHSKWHWKGEADATNLFKLPIGMLGCATAHMDAVDVDPQSEVPAYGLRSSGCIAVIN